jgi:hypothetical protein
MQVRKNGLRDTQMTSAEYVEKASWWSKEITRTYTRGPGDLDNAMIRVEREYGIAYATLWALRYRLPKTIDVAIFTRIAAAYRHCCERQQAKLAAELQATARIAGADHPACVAAAALVGEIPEIEGE